MILGGLTLCLTIIGKSFGLQCFKLGLLCLCLFGLTDILTSSFGKNISLYF
ncbi:MAG: YccF domain-containing protein [Flavobacteriales bacterium]